MFVRVSGFCQTIKRCRPSILLLTFVFLLVGCKQQEEPLYEPEYSFKSPHQQQTIYSFAVHPLHTPNRLFDIYQPLVRHLNVRLAPVTLRLEASSDYAAFENKLIERKLHLALPNPYQTIESFRHGYSVFAKMGDDQNFRGIILVRKDSGLEHPRDLRGKSVSYPAPTALAAAIMPQWFLHQQGIDVMRELDNRYVGTQESAIMSAVLGESVAGVTWPPPWRAFAKEHPALAEQLEVKWETPPLLNNALIARNDVPGALVERIARLLESLHETEEGQKILQPMELSRFERANNQTYAPMRAFIAEFEAQVRPVNAGK